MGWMELVLQSADSALRSAMGMRPKFLLRRQPQDSRPAKYSSGNPPQVPGPKASKIVKDRPIHFEDRYTLVGETRPINEVFSNMGHTLFEECDAVSRKARSSNSGRIILREQGKTSDGRPFMFFKPFNDFGWLMERTGSGWRISRAEKLVRQEMFLRSHSDPWDVVLLYQDPKGEGSMRVKSQRFGNTLMSLVVYEQKLCAAFMVELTGALN
jgi:hypothetical protein